jgi:hypothetical protein
MLKLLISYESKEKLNQRNKSEEWLDPYIKINNIKQNIKYNFISNY